ncbi:hypothetical protein HRbin40_02256 [bacterium HR40]|nr:hypothetical protein HRbin40_02256 [bacterium HR40]
MIRRTLRGLAVLSAVFLVVAPALAATPLRLCTGSPGKTYLRVGEKLAELAARSTMGQLAIEVVPTGGSLDNLDRTLAGRCDAFIAQGDAIAFYDARIQPGARAKFEVLGELYKELGLLLCHRGSGIDDLDEARGAVIAAGDTGSGSLATMLNLQLLAPELYGDIRIYPANGFEGALAVLEGKAACVFDVIAPQSDLVRILNDHERTGTQLRFAEIDNRDLENFTIDGKRIYDIVTFDDERYPNLAGFGDPETLAIGAVLGVAKAYLATNPQARSQLAMLLLMGAKDIEAVAYGEGKPFRD